MKKNLIQDYMAVEPNCHDGNGHIKVYRAFDFERNKSQLDFLDFVVLPPNCSIGRHKHGDNQEWYVVLKGTGNMYFKNQYLTVEPMDVMVNEPYGEHELINDSLEDIHLVVFQLSGEGCHATD